MMKLIEGAAVTRRTAAAAMNTLPVLYSMYTQYGTR